MKYIFRHRVGNPKPDYGHILEMEEELGLVRTDEADLPSTVPLRDRELEAELLEQNGLKGA